MSILDNIALSWVGTPYHHQAKLKDIGVDCCGLIAGIAEEAGILKDIQLPVYNLQWHLHSNEEKMIQYLEEYGCKKVDCDIKDINTWPNNSIICLKYGRANSHMGILVNNYLIHAAIDHGKVVQVTFSEDLINRVGAIYQYPEKL